MKVSIDFFMDSQVVGAFAGDALPKAGGSYRYEPYRGPGHVNLHRQLKAGHAPRCFYSFGSQRVAFCVTSSPAQGVLTMDGIEVEIIP